MIEPWSPAAPTEPDTRSKGAAAILRGSAGERLALAALLLLASAIYLTRLDRQGYGNLYYAAAVRSMTGSWKAFFFVAFDPASFISVDKPPVALWIQALSARSFGFSSWSVLGPNALAGIGSVAILFWVLRAQFGFWVALAGGLTYVLTPITAAVARDNNPDAILILFLLIGAWCSHRAVERGSLRWLIATGVAIALAFNTKMLAACLVVPAFVLMYLAAAPVSWRRRGAHVLILGAVALIGSSAWIAVVDTVPAASRPYVAGSTNNSELNLALNYNGLDRVAGTAPASARGTSALSLGRLERAGRGALSVNRWSRLLSRRFAPQTGWLIAFAGVALVATAAAWRTSLPTRAERGAFLFWSTWMIVNVVVLSAAASVPHVYYAVTLVPGLAAIAGIGVVHLVRAGVCSRASRAVLLAALLVGASGEGWILLRAPHWQPWLLSTVLIIVGVSALGVCVAWQMGDRVVAGTRTRAAVLYVAAVIGFAGLLVAPGVWAASTTWIARPNQGGDPLAGPPSPSVAHQIAVETRAGYPSHTFVRYLDAHRGHALFLLATIGSADAAPLIIKTGQPVLAIGGFGGYDPAPTATGMQRLIDDGEVGLVLAPARLSAVPPEARGPLSVVTRACRVIGKHAWSDAEPPLAGRVLYACTPRS